MKKIVTSILLITSILTFAQKIELGTIFTIEFDSLNKNMNFKIQKTNSFDEIIDISNMDSIIKSSPKENEIIGVFANGKFGKNTNSMLVLISGLTENLDYDIRIKTPHKRRFQKTSTSTLFKGVKSIEYWSYQIEEIDFKSFKSIPKENFQTLLIETKIDSTCIKNADKNIEFGKQEFKIYLELAISEFDRNKNFELGKMTKYENSINSEDVSLGHFWSLGEGIYPNTKGFKFGDPISYRRIECPYFEGKLNYFYTKENHNIKVISFNWETFNESNFGINPEIKNDVKNKFDEKFEYLSETINSLLGNPIGNITEESGQRKIRWKNEKGINAYLFDFGNHNEIRLYVYKE
ncbi:hypothetical protein GCM10022393_26930 [Aquimarina addita]|uniref:GLPGLI family protein n=1 Tax=Aquimarina addita TaxID=870485 RepID=A0ABP6UQD1_9FLAO